MFADFQNTAIAALDLDPIKFKLIHPESGAGWTREHADSVELEYRRFLYLTMKYPDEITAPSVDVDTFWHYHILDTMKYAADCERIFGYFLHHFPYYGMRGDEDLEALAQAGSRMQELYKETFGAYQSAEAQVLPQYSQAAARRQSAYCIISNDAAYCIKVAQPAYCIKGVEAAYCIRAAETAYCIKGVDCSDYGKNATNPTAAANGRGADIQESAGLPQSVNKIAAYCIVQSVQSKIPNLERPRLAAMAL